MDVQALGAALALAKKTVLPAVDDSDAGAQLVVASDGTWQKGEPTSAVISVSGTTLSITGGGE